MSSFIKKTDFLVAPSLLSCDFSKLGAEIKALEQAGADWIHWDIMDSHFVPQLTFGPPVLKALRPLSPLVFDVHLMVEHPDRLIVPFQKAGADQITFHIESASNPLPLIKKIKSLKLKAGLSLKPETPIHEVFPYLKELDMVLIMTVEPGAGGQAFLEKQAEKLFIIKEKIKELKQQVLLAVDGGIRPETAKQVSPADVLISGNYIFNSSNYSKSILKLKRAKHYKWEPTLN